MTGRTIDQLNLQRLTYYSDAQACGTMEYHYLSPLAKMVKLVATDGIYHMCEELACYWVIDQVGLEIPELTDYFYVVYVIPNDKGGFYFIMDDGNYNRLVEKEFPFTDLKPNLKLFLQKSEYWVLMLPSEY